MRLILEPMEGTTLHPRGPLVIRCLRGTLWITQARGADDRLLGAGESALLSSHRLYLSALRRDGPACFEVASPQAAISCASSADVRAT